MDVFKISVPNGIDVGTFDNTSLQYTALLRRDTYNDNTETEN